MEENNITMFMALFWYVAGIFSYRIMTVILNYAHASIIFERALIECIALLTYGSDNFNALNDATHQINKNKNKEAHESNKEHLKLWQEMMILTLITLTPKYLKGLVTFKDWDSAQRFLRQKRTQDERHSEDS